MTSSTIASGTVLYNRYRLVGIAGQGSFGQTYLARDQKQLNELCVLKEFIPTESDPAVLETSWNRFQGAAAILQELQHPQIPRCQSLIAQDQRFYWVREYIEGKSYGVLLDERKLAGKTFSEAEVLQLLAQLLPVLNYLHQRGVIHRNISPETLILRQRDQVPVLIDFGLVKELVAQFKLHAINPSTALGRWGYAPPEQLAGKVRPSSDLYALAVTAIVLLTGKQPEELYDSTAQRFDWETQVRIYPQFAHLLQQMLSLDAQQRPDSAAQILQMVQMLQRNALASLPEKAAVPPISGTPLQPLEIATPKVPRERLPRRRRKAPDLTASMVMGAALGLLLLVVLWKAFSRSRSQPQLLPSEVATSPVASSPKSSTPETSEPSNADPTPVADDRPQQLGVNDQFFADLVDDAFYIKYPQFRSQKLGNFPEQAKLKAEWNATADALASKLQNLPAETRQKLGSYKRANYEAFLAQLGEKGKTSKTLDGLADARFYELFPEWKGKPLNPRTFGQVWYAIAEAQLDKAKANQAGKN